MMNVANLIFILCLVFYPVGVLAENIDPNNDGSQYAYGETVGWLNAEPGGDGQDGVEVAEFYLTPALSGPRISAGSI